MEKTKSAEVQQLYNEIATLAESHSEELCMLLIPEKYRATVEGFERYTARSPFTLNDLYSWDGFLFGHFVRFEPRYSIDIVKT